MSETKLNVYLEIGAKRVFAAALDWPGWCRSGRGEEAALQALHDCGPRYAAALKGARLGFRAPASPAAFKVLARYPGNMTTDFGAPDAIPDADREPADAAEVKRLGAILKACWRSFDAAVEAARGRALRSGPRGGGRALDGIAEHVGNAELGYLSALGWKAQLPKDADPSDSAGLRRAAILEGLAVSARGEIPAVGPRGGKRWPAAYFVRRTAWHVLDHVWEIEDRSA